MLFQRQGGLQIQILETISELKRLGFVVELINPNVDSLNDYDLVHVFSAINGNYRLIQAAKGFAKPVVLSPLIQPDWSRFTGIRERFLDRLVGKLTGWHVQTTYREIATCLQLSDEIIALGEIEKYSITEAFKVSPKIITVIPNGIPQRFFEAKPDLFMEKHAVNSDFVLCVAAINRHKNQLGLVKALQGESCKVVLIGQCLETDKEYLSEILTFPNVLYLGSMEYTDPMLASAYAAATVFCLPSMSEVMPLCVLESLATGTPVVMTENHCMDLTRMNSVVKEVNPTDSNDIKKSVNELISIDSNTTECKDAVRDLSWHNVASEIAIIYKKLLNN